MESLKQPLKKQNFTTTSDALSTLSSKSGHIGQKLTDANRLGDLAEMYAITWLWDEGFEVFHNTGCTGAIDIVGIKDGEIYLFDVKANSSQVKNNTRGRTDLQKELGVQYIIFNPVTRKLRLAKHRN